VQSNGSSAVVVGPRRRARRMRRRVPTGRLVWPGLLRLMRRLTHYRPTDLLEFKMSFSVRDLLAPKGRAVKDQVEALVQAVQKAGSYQAGEDAVRAVHAVMDALKDRVPPDVLMKLSESLPVREGARLRRAVAQRLQDDRSGGAPEGVAPLSPAAPEGLAATPDAGPDGPAQA